jgi:hypothetical protein
MKAKSLWGDRTLAENKVESIALGDLQLWMQYKDSEIRIAYRYIADRAKSENVPADPPADIKWSRWAGKEDANTITLSPVFPDRPLVVQPEYPLRISPKAQIQVYSRIPLWVRISTTHDGYKLIEVPTVRVSRTWFGTPLEGELCYHAATKARRSLSEINPRPYLISCPISIINKSSEGLDFENFCYRVERLSIFEHEGVLWADETQIFYNGEDLNSDIIMSGKLPGSVQQKDLLTEPRSKNPSSIATRTFKRLLEDTNFFGR